MTHCTLLLIHSMRYLLNDDNVVQIIISIRSVNIEFAMHEPVAACYSAPDLCKEFPHRCPVVTHSLLLSV